MLNLRLVMEPIGENPDEHSDWLASLLQRCFGPHASDGPHGGFADYPQIEWEAAPEVPSGVGGFRVLAIRPDGQCAAHVALLDRRIEPFRIGGVSALCTGPEWQGLGLRRSVLSHAADCALAAGYDALVAWTAPEDSEVYSACGWLMSEDRRIAVLPIATSVEAAVVAAVVRTHDKPW